MHNVHTLSLYTLTLFYIQVVGDIVRLNAGDRIPADGLLVSGDDVLCNESSITGMIQYIMYYVCMYAYYTSVHVIVCFLRIIFYFYLSILYN